MGVINQLDDGFGISIGGGGSAFVGLLDTYSNAAAAYSVRRLSSTYSGPLVEIRRAGNNAVKDFYPDANNELSLASEDGSGTSLSTWIGGGSGEGFIRTWHDQSGNGNDYTQTSASAQTQIITAGVLNTKGGKPSITISKTTYASVASSTATFKFLHDGTACSYVAVNSFGTGSNPDDVYALFGNNTNSLGDIGYYMRFDDRSAFSRNNRLADYIPNSSGVASCNTEVDNSITPNQNNIMFANIDADNGTAANRAMYYVNNGSVIQNNTQAGTASTANASHDLYLGRLPTGGFPMVGTVSELIIWPTTQSANRTGIETNINDYFTIY